MFDKFEVHMIPIQHTYMCVYVFPAYINQGRCPAEYSKMMGSIRKSDKCCLTVSVELEKRKLELLELVPHADVVSVLDNAHL